MTQESIPQTIINIYSLIESRLSNEEMALENMVNSPDDIYNVQAGIVAGLKLAIQDVLKEKEYQHLKSIPFDNRPGSAASYFKAENGCSYAEALVACNMD